MPAFAQPQPWRGLAAGIVVGLVASAVMSAFQAVAAKPLGQDDRDDDPATVKLANKTSKAVTGTAVPEPRRAASGEAVHYLTGAALGGAYGLLAEYKLGASVGFGSAYGIATNLLLDDAAVPALGLGDAPWTSSIATQAYGASSHIVFGVVLEAVRRLIGGRTAA